MLMVAFVLCITGGKCLDSFAFDICLQTPQQTIFRAEVKSVPRDVLGPTKLFLSSATCTFKVLQSHLHTHTHTHTDTRYIFAMDSFARETALSGRTFF
jgi:hypothetical protein